MPTGRFEPAVLMHDVFGAERITHLAPTDAIIQDAGGSKKRVGLTHGHPIFRDLAVQEDSRMSISDLVSTDLRMLWSNARPQGIERSSGALWSGHANDALRTKSALLVASDSGGLWLLSDSGPAVNVGHGWGKPDVHCLVRGSSDQHVLSVGAGLYSSLWNSSSLRWWRPVEMPTGVDDAYAAVYVRDRNTVVLADNIGVHYAVWPTEPGDPWLWAQVAGLPGRFSGVAVGPEAVIVAAYWGVDLAQGYYGIVRLMFDDVAASGELILHERSVIAGADERLMQRVSLTSCEMNRNRMYASAAGAGDDGSYLVAVLRSDDGGRNWKASGTAVAIASTLPTYAGDLPEIAGHQGNYNNCIEVSPISPDTVLLGWCTSGPLLSLDGGENWTLKCADQNSAHLHSDLHSVRFDVNDKTGRSFYVCSDGGVARTSDMGDTYVSSMNGALADLQFQSTPSRQFLGSFSASPVLPGVVAGGLQDNGIVVGQIASDAPWQQMAGGDGFRCAFLRSGQLVFTSNGAPAPRICDWKEAKFHIRGTVPVEAGKFEVRRQLTPTQEGLVDQVPDGPAHSFRNTVFVAVPQPTHRNNQGMVMQAIGSVYGDVYGLFSDDDGSKAVWQQIGSVPLNSAADDIRSLGAYHGDNVYVGTSDGRIFALDASTSAVIETNVTTRRDSSMAITGIAAYDSYESAYAIHGTHLLRLAGFLWEAVTGLPDETLYGVAVSSANGSPVVVVATEGAVFSSRDGGNTWLVANNGLPERPKCAGLAIGPTFSGGTAVYLATYGRSVWWTPLK